MKITISCYPIQKVFLNMVVFSFIRWAFGILVWEIVTFGTYIYELKNSSITCRIKIKMSFTNESPKYPLPLSLIVNSHTKLTFYWVLSVKWYILNWQMLFSRRVTISWRSFGKPVWAFKIWIPNGKATQLSREHVSSQSGCNCQCIKVFFSTLLYLTFSFNFGTAL